MKTTLTFFHPLVPFSLVWHCFARLFMRVTQRRKESHRVFMTKAWVMFLLCLTPFPLFALESFQILDQHPNVNVTQPFSISTTPKSPEEAYAAFKKNHFRLLPETNRSLSFHKEPVWLGIEISNGCSQDLFLSFVNQSLHRIDYYVYQNDTLIAQGKTGAEVPFHQRILHAYDLRIPLLSHHAPVTYLMKVSTQSPLIVPVVLGTDGAIQLFHLPKIIGMTLFGGVFLALFLYNCILFMTTKEKDYLLYSLYIFSLFCLIASTREYFSFFVQNALFLNGGIKLFSLLASVFFLVLFTLEFLNIKTHSIRLYRFTLYALAAILLMIGTMPLGFVGKYMGLSAIFSTLFLASFLGVFAKIKGNPLATFYLIAVGGFFLGVMNMLGIIFGILPYSVITYMTPMIGSAWEMILFSLALGYKIRLLSQEHTKAMTHIQAQNKMLFLQSRYTSVGELIRNITHQWKEPLGEIGAIQTNLKSTLLLKGSITKEKLINAIDLSHTIIAHLAETIDTFYRFFRSHESEQSEFNIVKEVENIRKLVKYTFDTEQIDLQCTYQTPYVLLYGHPNEFAHAVLNIVLNAKEVLIQRHIQNPYIHIDISLTSDEIVVRIEDNGGGITQQPLEKIFDIGTSAYKENIGIGLFIAKTIVEQKMGGSIRVQNTADGALFTLSFPLAQTEHRTQPQPSLFIEESALQRISRLEKDIERYVEIEKNLQQWADIFEKAHWGIAICDARSKTLTLMNPAFLQLYGYSESELRHQSVITLFSDEWKDHMDEIFHIVNQTNQYTFEATHVRHNAQLFPVDIDMIAVKTDLGELLYYIINVRDITHFRNTHKRLLLKTFALQHIHEAVFLVNKNAQFQYVNHEACRSLGYTQQELLQLKISDIDALWPSDTWAEHWKTLESQKTVTLETLHKRKDGTTFPVEVVVNYIEYDDTYLAMGLARDISERRLLEERKEDARMRLFFEKQLVGMAISSPEKNWLKVNDKLCTMFGYTQEELTNKTWSEITYPDDLEPDVRQFERVLRGEIEGFTIQKRFIRKDGSLLYTNLSTTCIRRADHSAEYFLTLIEDISEQTLAHEALAQKEQELRSLAESSPGMMGSFCLRPDGSMYMPYVSPNIIDIFGVHAEEVKKDAMSLMALTHPDDTQRIHASILKSAEKMSVWHEEYRIIHPLKGERWMESNTKPEQSANGDITWYGYVHDITERKRIEEQLQENQAHLAAIISTMPDLIFLKDSNGVYRMCNPAFERFFGAPANEIIGKTDYDFVTKEQADFFRQKDAEAIASGTICINEEEITFADSGQSAIVETRKVPVYDNKTLIGLLGIGRDITERKKSELAIAEARQLLHSLLQSIPDPVWMKDVHGRFLACNHGVERLFNTQEKDIIGKDDYDFFEPEQAEFYRNKDRSSVDADHVRMNEELWIFRDNGEEALMETRKVPVKNEDGTLLGTIGVARDITERKRIEEQLKKNETSLNKAQNIAKIGSWELDIKSDTLTWSDETYRIFELEREHTTELHKTFYEIVHPEDREKVSAPYLESVKAKRPYSVEHRIVMRDGRIKYVIETCETQYDEEGNPTVSIGTVQDITERHQMESVVKETNERYTQILDNSIDVIYLIAVTPEGHFIYVDVNAAFEKVTGLSRDVVVGLDVENVENEAFRAILIDKFTACLNAGKITDYVADYPFPGGIRTFHSVLAPIRDKSGQIVRIVGAARDITERKQFENTIQELNATLEEKIEQRTQQLQQALEFSNGVINALPDLLFEIDLSGTYLNVWARDEELLAKHKELLLGHNVYEVLSHEAADTIMEALQEAYIKGTSFGKTIKIELPQETMYFEESVSKKMSSDTFLVLSHDITERKKAEMELIEREEKFSKLFKLSPSAISITSLERGIYLDVNDSFLRYSEYAYEEVVGKSSAELNIFAHPEDRAELFRRVIKEGFISDFEYAYRTKSGRIGYAAAYGSVIHFKGERCFIGHSYDMNERHHAQVLQQERLNLEERLSKIAQAAPGVNYIFEKTVDQNVRFNYLSPRFEEIFGLSMQEATANFGALVEKIDSQDRDKIRQSITATEQNLTLWHEEFRIHHPLKGLIWIEGRSFPEKQADGSILWYGFFHDVTERKHAEMTLAKSKEAFRAMVDNSPDVIARYDLNYRRLYVNPQMQRLLCDQPLDVILQSPWEHYSPLADVKDFQTKFQSVIEHQQEITFEAPFFMPDKNVHWGLIRLIPEFNADNDVISVLLVGRDITHEKETLKGLELFKTAIDKSDQAIYIIDENSVIAFANAKACDMLGYTHEELIGQFIWKVDTFMAEEDILAVMQKVRLGETFRFETQHRTREGSIIDVEVKSTLFCFEQTYYGIAFVSQRKNPLLKS
jgi:PAS domain S-box-containing protein